MGRGLAGGLGGERARRLAAVFVIGVFGLVAAQEVVRGIAGGDGGAEKDQEKEERERVRAEFQRAG